MIHKKLALGAFLALGASVHPITLLVTTTADSGPGSLRDALVKVNAEHDVQVAHQIVFQIPTSDEGYTKETESWTIKPVSPLPIITSPVDINGYSCPGALANTRSFDQAHTAQIKIELQGSGSKGDPLQVLNGLVLGLGSDGSTIRGLCINRFSRGSGILLQSNGTKVQGCFIGSDCTGMVSFPNATAISNEGEDTLIGGTLPAERNLLAGSSGPLGVVSKPLGSAKIIGNLIGLNKEGTKALDSESQVGIYFGGAHFNSSTIAQNVIAGNTLVNVYINAFPYDAPVTIEGNKIGTDCSGFQAIKGNGIGVALFTAPSYFSSDALFKPILIKGNLISGNTYGIVVNSSVPHQAQGVDVEISENTIGLNADESQPVSNTLDGLFLDSAYGSLIRGNRIGGNGGNGIRIGQTRGVVMQSNYIGFNASSHSQPNLLNTLRGPSSNQKVQDVRGGSASVSPDKDQEIVVAPVQSLANPPENLSDVRSVKNFSSCSQEAPALLAQQDNQSLVETADHRALAHQPKSITDEEQKRMRRRRMANLRRR